MPLLLLGPECPCGWDLPPLASGVLSLLRVCVLLYKMKIAMPCAKKPVVPDGNKAAARAYEVCSTDWHVERFMMALQGSGLEEQ